MRCSIVHAVWYEPSSNSRCSVTADTPVGLVTNRHAAANHTLNGVLVRRRIVPAVTERRNPHREHIERPSPSAHAASTLPQATQ